VLAKHKAVILKSGPHFEALLRHSGGVFFECRHNLRSDFHATDPVIRFRRLRDTTVSRLDDRLTHVDHAVLNY